MRPSDLKSLKALLGAIRAELAYLRETVEQRFARLTHEQLEQQKATQEEWKKTQEILAQPLRTDPDEQTAGEVNEERRHRQNLLVQWVLALGTLLAFAAAAIYAGIAACQLQEMKIATQATRDAAKAAASGAETAANSAKLSRQLAEGTQQAVLTEWMQFGNQTMDQSELIVRTANYGHVIAPNFTADITVSVVALPSGKVIHSYPRHVSPMPLLPNDPQGSGSPETEFFWVGYDRTAASNYQQTITVEMKGNYENGFGTRFPIILCKSFLTQPSKGNQDWINCEEFKVRRLEELAFKKKAGTQPE